MRKLCVNFLRLILLLVPPHKRQEVRLFILRSLVDLLPVYNEFDSWRSEQHRLVNMNSQARVLECYLRLKIHPLIRIITSGDLLLISLFVEGQLVGFGLEETESENLVPLPLLGEITEDFAGVDFIVLIPPNVSVDREKLTIEIEKFKAINTTYKILVK